MNPAELELRFGKDYPASVMVHGIRLPLSRESRFMRHYHSQEKKLRSSVSRFMDGSATITAAELKSEWPTLTPNERSDFCQSCDWLDGQGDFPEMLRFVMRHGEPQDWLGIALSVASRLPCDEAFGVLVEALRGTEIGHGHSCNIARGIAKTGHSGAEAVLRRHLETVWAQKSLWDDHTFMNWGAFDAITCIAHLLELGVPTTDFEARVCSLSQHVCSRTRESCRNFLAKHYPWLTQQGRRL